MNPIRLQLSTILPQLTRNSAQAEKKASDWAGEPNPGQDIFSRLNQLNAQSIQNRKRAAQARIAELKQRIENMMRFANIGKGNPQMVAQLAKELKTLVAQYGGTGGGMVTMQATNGPTSEQSELSDTVADTTNSQTPAATAQVPSQANTPMDASDKSNSAAESSTETQNATPASHFKLGSQGGDAGDKAFFAEVKKLSNMLKQLLAMENRKLKTEADQQELKAAKKSIRELEEATVKAESQLASESAQPATPESGAIYTASGEASVSSSTSISIFA